MNINEAKFILGIVLTNFSLEELKKIFKQQMLQWHPDVAVNRGISEREATSKSQKIILAYNILSESLKLLEDSSYKYNYGTYHNYKTSTTKSYKQYYDHITDTIDEHFISRITLTSSNVKWIDYIKDLEILVVRFKNSAYYYLYHNVPESVYLKFQKAESPGKFVHQFLNGYQYECHSKYAEWLNVYKSLNDFTNDT